MSCRVVAEALAAGAASANVPAAAPQILSDAAGVDAAGRAQQCGNHGLAKALGLRTAADACSLWGICGLPIAQLPGGESRRCVVQLLHDTMGALSLLPHVATCGCNCD